MTDYGAELSGVETSDAAEHPREVGGIVEPNRDADISDPPVSMT